MSQNIFSSLLNYNTLTQMELNGITVVSLGPGDHEMITLKGLHALEKADIIFSPMTRKGSKELSRSGEMISALGIDTSKIELYYLPMSLDRENTLEIYQGVAERCIELYLQGKEVVITAEGDGGFYSSSQYIHEMIAERGYRVERIAGVPAFIDCAALAAIHIASGDRSLQIIPFVENKDVILDNISLSTPRRVNLVLMKLSQSETAIKEAIGEAKDIAKFHYIENRGRKNEFYSSNIELILERKFPYFSILIIEVI